MILKPPTNYAGSKDKLMPQLLNYFPDNVDTFYDVGAKNFNYDQNVPYNYIGLTADQVEKVKSRIEAESKELAKPEIEKREANKKRLAAANKERAAKKAEKKTTERKTPTKKK